MAHEREQKDEPDKLNSFHPETPSPLAGEGRGNCQKFYEKRDSIWNHRATWQWLPVEREGIKHRSPPG